MHDGGRLSEGDEDRVQADVGTGIDNNPAGHDEGGLCPEVVLGHLARMLTSSRAWRAVVRTTTESARSPITPRARASTSARTSRAMSKVRCALLTRALAATRPVMYTSRSLAPRNWVASRTRFRGLLSTVSVWHLSTVVG